MLEHPFLHAADIRQPKDGTSALEHVHRHLPAPVRDAYMTNIFM